MDLSILRGYELYVDDGLGGPFKQAYDGFNKPYETSFVATNLVPGRTYRAYARALNVVGEGPNTDIIYQTMSVEPSAPQNLGVITNGNTSVTCSWEPPSNNGGEPVAHYIMEYAAEPLFNAWVEDGPNPDNTEFTKNIFNLVQGTLYQFRVRAVNPAGRGTASNIVSTIVGTAPTAAPTGLTRAATTSVSLTWAWIPLADMYTGGAPLGGHQRHT